MYQKLILFILLILAKNSSSSSDLLNYQMYSSNSEISYFINYLDHFLSILNQSLNEIDNSHYSNNTNELIRNSTCFNHIQYSINMARKEQPESWALQSKFNHIFFSRYFEIIVIYYFFFK